MLSASGTQKIFRELGLCEAGDIMTGGIMDSGEIESVLEFMFDSIGGLKDLQHFKARYLVSCDILSKARAGLWLIPKTSSLFNWISTIWPP